MIEGRSLSGQTLMLLAPAGLQTPITRGRKNILRTENKSGTTDSF